MTDATYPIGHDFCGPGGERWRCASHDECGYWMVDMDAPTRSKNVSERAIDRTFHHLRHWRCEACSRGEVGHRRHAALGPLLGNVYWTYYDVRDEGDAPWLRVTCYGCGPGVAIVVDDLQDEEGGFDIYLPVSRSAADPAEKIAALHGRRRALDAAWLEEARPDARDVEAGRPPSAAELAAENDALRELLHQARGSGREGVRCLQNEVPGCGHPHLEPDCLECVREDARRCSLWETFAVNERNQLREFMRHTGHTYEDFETWLAATGRKPGSPTP